MKKKRKSMKKLHIYFANPETFFIKKGLYLFHTVNYFKENSS